LIGIKDFWKTFISVENPPTKGGYTTVHTIFGAVKCGKKAVEGWNLMDPSPHHQLSITAYAKARLKPKKQNLTIPQLELMALLIATRAATFVQKEGDFIALPWQKQPLKRPRRSSALAKSSQRLR
jgi:hypothetical protein